MITLKKAIKEWEDLLGETMIGYSALTRKACTVPDQIFVIAYWDKSKDLIEYKSFEVGLKKTNGRWMVDIEKFKYAVIEKINAVEYNNEIGKANVQINYPVWVKPVG